MGLFSFITKDVAAEDESKRVMVVLRILYLILLVATVLNVALIGLDLIRSFYLRIFCLIAADILLFQYTYHARTKKALILFVLYIFAWAFFLIPCFGWIAGIQNCFIIVLMLCFFAVHESESRKFMYAALVLGARIMIINLYGGIDPGVNITFNTEKWLQVVNITAVFTAVAIISSLFSKKENEAEEKLTRYNDRLKKEANTDQLTGLYNRRKAKEFLSDMSSVRGESVFSLAIGDIDFFKKVNDTYGHDAGDEVLKAVARTMIDSSRSTTFISRWGGEEFLIIFPDCNGDHAFIALERLRRTLENQVIKVGDKEIKVTMTFGLAEYDFNKDEESSIKEADEKLYLGKQNGRNQVVF